MFNPAVVPDKKISTVAYNEPAPVEVEEQELLPIPSPSWEFLLPLLKVHFHQRQCVIQVQNKKTK